MQAIRVRLFGTPALQWSAGNEPLLPERMTQLAVVLAARGEWVTRDQLIGLLWPELDDEAARRNLRKVLFRARRQPWFEGLETRTNALRWSADSDLRDFETAVAQLDWELAVSAYSGSFCEGFEHKAAEPFVEWLRFERNRLAAAYRSAAARRLAQLADDASAREAVARQWLALDPLDEDALATLADALRAQERGGEAQRVVGEFTQRVVREVGVAPSARVRALDEARSVAESPMPADTGLAGFVGRRAELREAEALLLRDECRVLTLMGPGGVGKSRLARALVGRLRATFSDVVWVGLEDLTGIEQVVPRIAAALDVSLPGAADPLEQLVSVLSNRQPQLLVFDNAEHLPEFSAVVERLTKACGAVKLLVTSRARLAVSSEWLLPLHGLATPDVDETETEAIRAFDSVKLFELRARAAAPAFDAARAAGEVAALVRSIEGAPLAIELAAAWVRLLPVSEIRREIERSLDLLEGGAHAPDRHRSVRASFEHSWRLLTPVEQHCLAQLAVFAGPFTRAAADQVAQTRLPVLAALADKSLLRAEGDGRFAFHALIRQCAGERLSAEAKVATSLRYREFYSLLCERLTDPVRHGRKDALAELELELENCRVAWLSALTVGDFRTIERMVAALLQLYELRRPQQEGLQLFGGAAEVLRGDAEGGAAARAEVLNALSWLQYRSGALDRAIENAREALGLLRRLGRQAGERRSLGTLGAALRVQGAFDEARQHLETALQSARSDEDMDWLAAAANNLALLEADSGHLDRAVALYSEAVAGRRVGDNPRGLTIALNNLGTALMDLRRFDEALPPLEEALAICEAHGLASMRSPCLANLGLAHFGRAALESAAACFASARAAAVVSGDALVEAAALICAARVSIRRRELALALNELRDGTRLAQRVGFKPVQFRALLGWGELLAARGEQVRAVACWSAVAQHAQAPAPLRTDAAALLRAPAPVPASERAVQDLDTLLYALVAGA